MRNLGADLYTASHMSVIERTEPFTHAGFLLSLWASYNPLERQDNARMHTDIFGQDTTIGSRDALESWNDCLMAFMAHGATTPVHLGETLTRDPNFALGHAVKGIFYILLGRSELMDTAREALGLAQASSAMTTLTAREQSFINALSDWLSGRPSAAIAHLEDVLAVHPTDTLAMKLSHAIRFVLGDGAGMRRSVERVMGSYDASHLGRGYLLGCHAFTLEEAGEYARAEKSALAGLAISSDDAWGLHAIAHVYDMTADAAGGIKWLSGRESAWAHCNNFRYHVWWHKALMHLDLGQYDVALALYDTEIRADKTDDYRDISNATSLLSRMELDGVQVGDRWEELADLSANRTEDGCLIFADLHYLLALIGGRRDEAIRSMMGRIHTDAIRRSSEMDALMKSPGLSAAAGLEAFGEADFITAFSNLAAARKDMQLAGGSHAQRDVFDRLTIDAGIRAGRLDQAETFLRDRKAKRGGYEDGYCAARFELISQTRDASGCAARVPAE